MLIDKITSELDLTYSEAKVFLYLLKNGQSEIHDIVRLLDEPLVEIETTCHNLVKKGMIIEPTINRFQSVHPRFAAVNAYRLKCLRSGHTFMKNPNIDSIGMSLEKFAISEKTK
jgi:hypothetical protein